MTLSLTLIIKNIMSNTEDYDNCFRHVFSYYNILTMISEKSKDKNIDMEKHNKNSKKTNRRDKIEGLNFEVCRTC